MIWRLFIATFLLALSIPLFNRFSTATMILFLVCSELIGLMAMSIPDALTPPVMSVAFVTAVLLPALLSSLFSGVLVWKFARFRVLSAALFLGSFTCLVFACNLAPSVWLH